MESIPQITRVWLVIQIARHAVTLRYMDDHVLSRILPITQWIVRHVMTKQHWRRLTECLLNLYHHSHRGFIAADSAWFFHRTIEVVPFDLCSNQSHSISVVISAIYIAMVIVASLLQLRPDSPPNDQLSPIKFPQSSAPFHFRIHQRPTTVWPGLMPASISTFRFEVFFPTRERSCMPWRRSCW